jgi:hypothetical protein
MELTAWRVEVQPERARKSLPFLASASVDWLQLISAVEVVQKL